MKTPKIVEILVDADNIDEHLEKCKSNRARTRKHINTWKRAISKGNFRDGGFIFADEDGDYDDGQHRLYALKETGHSAMFYLVSGIDRPTLNMMVDGGKKRTNTDRLKAMQVKYAPLINSSIEEILDLQESWRKYAAMLLPDETLSFYKENRNELDYYAKAYYRFPDIADEVLVAFAYLFKRIDEQKANQFFVDLTHRSLLKPGQPLYAFYKMLGSEKLIMTERPALRNRYIKNGLIIAWNAMLKDETLESIELVDAYITIAGTVSAEYPPGEEDIDEGHHEEPEAETDETEGEGDENGVEAEPIPNN